MYVEFFGLSADGESVSLGRIVLDGEALTVDPPSQMLEEILAEPVALPDETFVTRETPLEFLEALHLQYRSPYLTASPVQDREED